MASSNGDALYNLNITMQILYFYKEQYAAEPSNFIFIKQRFSTVSFNAKSWFSSIKKVFLC